MTKQEDEYGPVAKKPGDPGFGDSRGPFRGKRLTWDEYENSWRIDLTGLAFWAKVPDDHRYRRVGIIYVVGFGYVGSLNEKTHTVTEHEDETITVSPSLIIDGPRERWHGWLERGVFRGAFEPLPVQHVA